MEKDTNRKGIMTTFEEIQLNNVTLLNEGVGSSLNDLVDLLLRKGLEASTAEDKTRITRKAMGALYAINTYGEQLTQVKTFKEVNDILAALHADFDAEPVDDVARGMDQAGIVIYNYIN
jgi:hypothetical protein